MRFITTLLVLLFALPVLADETVEALQLSGGCWQYTLCKAQSSNGDCTDTDGDNYVASFSTGYSHTLFSETSDSTPYTCTVRSARASYSATIYGTTSPAITVTEAVEVRPVTGMLGKFWLNCAVTGGSTTFVTAYVLSCPLAK